MDYEALYKEALERASKLEFPYYKQAAEIIFPQLAESEEEKTRKKVLELIKKYASGNDRYQMAYWVEKKKEGSPAPTETLVLGGINNSVAQDKALQEWTEESEDEGIGKFIIDCIDELRKANAENAEFNGRCSEAIAYLEKQKEQKPAEKPKSYDSMDDLIADALIEMVKESDLIDRDKKNRLVWIERHRAKPAEWSLTDATFIEEIDETLYMAETGRNEVVKNQIERERNWLESLPERLNLQPKQEWSEEDEGLIDLAIAAVEDFYDRRNPIRAEIIDFLKSLRPSWKPSDEQMWALDVALENFYHKDDRAALESLRADLKKYLSYGIH